MKCPECGNKNGLKNITEDEIESYQLEDGSTIYVPSKNIPKLYCKECGLKGTGAVAARIRQANLDKQLELHGKSKGL